MPVVNFYPVLCTNIVNTTTYDTEKIQAEDGDFGSFTAYYESPVSFTVHFDTSSMPSDYSINSVKVQTGALAYFYNSVSFKYVITSNLGNYNNESYIETENYSVYENTISSVTTAQINNAYLNITIDSIGTSEDWDEMDIDFIRLVIDYSGSSFNLTATQQGNSLVLNWVEG